MSSSLNALSVSAVSCCLLLVVTPLASGAHNKVVTTLGQMPGTTIKQTKR